MNIVLHFVSLFLAFLLTVFLFFCCSFFFVGALAFPNEQKNTKRWERTKELRQMNKSHRECTNAKRMEGNKTNGESTRSPTMAKSRGNLYAKHNQMYINVSARICWINSAIIAARIGLARANATNDSPSSFCLH